MNKRDENRRSVVAQSKMVLIIEDEDILAENLQAHFRRCGWDARIACNGKAAAICNRRR